MATPGTKLAVWSSPVKRRNSPVDNRALLSLPVLKLLNLLLIDLKQSHIKAPVLCPMGSGTSVNAGSWLTRDVLACTCMSCRLCLHDAAMAL